MITLGLTGSIGMGKSTTAKIFAEEGAFLWDADQAVHRLYGQGGAAVPAIEALAPEAISDGAVDRKALRQQILEKPELLKQIEAVVHPLVGEDRAAALAEAEKSGVKIAVCDVPLLFETGGNTEFDHVVVVSAPEDQQRARVLSRPGMDVTSFEMILSRQVPDEKKRKMADFVINTGSGLAAARAQVQALMTRLLEENPDA